MRPVGGIVAVPVLVLRAGKSMQVEDGVDAGAARTRRSRVSSRRNPASFDVEGPHVVLEMPVVHRDADVVHAERGEEARVVLGEERIHEARRRTARSARGPSALQQRLARRDFRRRIAGEEVLHVHPAADIVAAELDGASGPVGQTVAGDGEQALRIHGSPCGKSTA